MLDEHRLQIISFFIVAITLVAASAPHRGRDNAGVLNQRLAVAVIRKAPLAEYRNCLKAQRLDCEFSATFVLAVLAVENYGRPPLKRWLKECIAKMAFCLTGKLPDISLGVGQLKPSTTRTLLTSNECPMSLPAHDDAQILRLSLNPCSNILLVNQYLTLLMHEEGGAYLDRTIAEAVLRRYNGQRTATAENQRYLDVTWQVFQILVKSASTPQAP